MHAWFETHTWFELLSRSFTFGTAIGVALIGLFAGIALVWAVPCALFVAIKWIGEMWNMPLKDCPAHLRAKFVKKSVLHIDDGRKAA